jgi:hypothetical protein
LLFSFKISARPRSNENRFGLFVFGAIADHVHCHSARHVLIVVVVVTTFSPFGQRIVGTHEDTKNDFNDDVCRTNNNKNKRGGGQKGAPSRRLWSRWCRRSLKLDSLRLFISREECVICMKGIECAVVRCPSLYLFDRRRRRRERRRRGGEEFVAAALTARLRLSREEEGRKGVCGGGLLLRV